MNGGFFLNIVIADVSIIFELFAAVNESLLIGRYTLFIGNFLFYLLDSIVGFDFDRDRFSG